MRISEMAKTTLENTTETGAISPRGCTLITELPEIIIHIFQYLKDGELDLCRQVCTKWNDIIENIMYHRVTMMTRKIPFNIIITAIHESENLRPYVGFDDNFQYSWFVLGDKSDRPVLTTDDLKRFKTPTLEPIQSHKYTYFMHSYNPNSARNFYFAHYKYSSTDITEIQISMFPNIPGFNIFNYSFTLRGKEAILYHKSDLIKEIENVCHKINIPDGQKKCIIFYKDITVYSFETEHSEDHRNLYRLTLFHGEKVNAFPVYIYEGETGYTTIQKKLNEMKYCELKMVQKKCFAYIFYDACTKCVNSATRAFSEVFPLVKYVAHHFLLSYLSIIPSKIEYFRKDSRCFIPCTIIMVFVWWE